jgi:FkbM family methyltransferase
MQSKINLLYHRIPLKYRKKLWLAWFALRDRSSADFLVLLGRPLVTVGSLGARFKVDLNDRSGVGRQLYERGMTEDEETRWLTNVLRPGMTVVDVGANIGYYSVLAAQQVGASGRVLAFEPDPRNYQLLLENIALNNAANVLAFNTALGERKGGAKLRLSPDNHGDHRLWASSTACNGREEVDVSVERLEDVLVDHDVGTIDLMKVDVQGYEYHVQSGMASLLASGKVHAILSEFWPDGIDSAGGSAHGYLVRFLSSGYTLSAMVGGEWVPCESAEDVMSMVPGPKFPNDDSSYLNILVRIEK